MSNAQSVDVPIVITGQQVQFLRRLSRISAGNVVREESPTGATIGRVHCHVGEHTKHAPYLKRKRTQPVGSTPCGECGKLVSANKGICADCQTKREASPSGRV